jgi:hypothetical protein
LPSDKKAPKELKVTDKRIFTADGEIREEFQKEIRPAEGPATAAPTAEPSKPPATPAPEAKPQDAQQHAGSDDRRRTVGDAGTNPGTPFTTFLETLILQAYMSLGMLRNPYQPQARVDTAAARQLIDILSLLKEKTAGNLAPNEQDYLDAHLGELKLAFVQRTKTI